MLFNSLVAKQGRHLHTASCSLDPGQPRRLVRRQRLHLHQQQAAVAVHPDAQRGRLCSAAPHLGWPLCQALCQAEDGLPTIRIPPATTGYRGRGGSATTRAVRVRSASGQQRPPGLAASSSNRCTTAAPYRIAQPACSRHRHAPPLFPHHTWRAPCPRGSQSSSAPSLMAWELQATRPPRLLRCIWRAAQSTRCPRRKRRAHACMAAAARS